LTSWRDGRRLPRRTLDNLVVVDADRLHRAGPRFIDGMAQLCDALARASANGG
jgi:hypothetical protein